MENATVAYLAKDANDEVARRRIEGTTVPPLGGDDRPVIQMSRTMDEWCDATAIELLDGPLVFGFDDDTEPGWD